ncbi:gamma-glutamyl-gamma-aminobutyrate hydrolase family protein [Paracidobacterium acidisoli]|uniref:Gamma-glutamyl-gamma-aminobutyrate hydrolase family protein n=1 Tax=Paracidobacterium acidisoli TaxID=2303751 RepID=A0A372IMN2_9BACT|nr:gamma-glutamyl-gamma-aminobutyrate hydrolase family protein [Paracidobacterium acidisoli]MBT9331840.1 gamma-glutamyl-gamma-aminobutyrate hydrolase family protein [Paracidobacterium acidisoli]
MKSPRIAIPEPTSADPEYNQRAWPQYAHAVEASGGIAVKVPLSSSPAEVARLAASCEGVLLPGSPADVNPQKYGEEPVSNCAAADPAREAVDELLLQDASNLRKPLLGICYGFQSLNVWRGGALVQDLQTPVNHRPGRTVREAHTVQIGEGSRLRALLHSGPELTVNSSHHQAVKTVGDGLIPAAVSAKDGVIEAAEGKGEEFILGIQWHPERFFDEDEASHRLFQAFIHAAAGWELRPIRESLAE